MTHQEILDSLRYWNIGGSRIYRLKRALAPDEYITLAKQGDDLFKTLETQSTYNLGDINQENIVKMIGKRELTLVSESTWSEDVFRLKTGNCCCGAWATVNKDEHADWCRKLPVGKVR